MKRTIFMQIGDEVTRNMAGIKIKFKITELTSERIICGPWEFDRRTGAEIDDDLGWGPYPKMTGSYIEECGATVYQVK